jgi:hypothetical protein
MDLYPSSDEIKEISTLLGPLERANLNHWTTHVEGEVNLQPSASLHLVSSSRPESMTIILFSDICGILHVGHPVWREDGSVINSYNYFGVLPEKSLSGPKSSRTHDHLLLPHMRLPKPGGSCPRIYIPQEQSGPVMPVGTEFPHRRLLRLAGLKWRYSNPHPQGDHNACHTTAINSPATSPSQREIARNRCNKNCGGACIEWNYNKNGGDNSVHKSDQQTKNVTPVYINGAYSLQDLRFSKQ